MVSGETRIRDEQASGDDLPPNIALLDAQADVIARASALVRRLERETDELRGVVRKVRDAVAEPDKHQAATRVLEIVDAPRVRELLSIADWGS